MIDTIPLTNQNRIDKITYEPRYSVICSEGGAPFSGVMRIDYRPENRLLEFESFEEWLYSLAMKEYTIEDLCRLVYNVLDEVLGDISFLRVEVRAETTVHAPVRAVISKRS